MEQPVVTLELPLVEFAVLTNLVALGICMMQNDKEEGMVFVQNLSDDVCAAAAKAIMGKLKTTANLLKPAMSNPINEIVS